MLATPAFQASTQSALIRANNKPPLEVVVANYKGLIFQEFQFVRWEYSAEVCMAYVKDAAGSEHVLLFGDWTESADGMWSAYTHADELVAAAG